MSNQKLLDLKKSLQANFTKSYTIDWNPKTDGTLESILVFDNMEYDKEWNTPFTTIAMYDYSDTARYVEGISNYIKDFECWKRAVNKILGYNVDWDILKEKGSITICW